MSDGQILRNIEDISDMVSKKKRKFVEIADFKRLVDECLVGLASDAVTTLFITTDSTFFKGQIIEYLAKECKKTPLLKEYKIIKLKYLCELPNEEELNEIVASLSASVKNLVLYIENIETIVTGRANFFDFLAVFENVKAQNNLESLKLIATVGKKAEFEYITEFYQKEFQYYKYEFDEPDVEEFNEIIGNDYFKSIHQEYGIYVNEKCRKYFHLMFQAMYPFENQSINDYLKAIDNFVAYCRLKCISAVKKSDIRAVLLKEKCPEDITKKVLKRTAIHEVGHLVVAMISYKQGEFDFLYITNYSDNENALGKTLGIVNTGGEETLTQVKASLSYNLGGMAAYEVMKKEPDNGCDADLECATEEARAWLTKTGTMSDGGIYHYGRLKHCSEKTKRMIEKETRKLMKEAYNDAVKILKKNKKLFKALVKELCKKRILPKEDVNKIYEKYTKKH